MVILMKKEIKSFLFFFILFVILIVMYHKYIGEFHSLKKAYSWDQIIESLPSTIILAIIIALLLLYDTKSDRNDE